MSKFILGTATFGSVYGIANKGIQTSNRKIKRIINVAQNNEIEEFDTAPSYGKAEVLLGKFMDSRYGTKVSSKISQKECISVESIIESINKTLINTNKKKLCNLLLHDPEPFNSTTFEILREGLLEAVKLDIVDRIGASVYSIESLLRIKEFIPEMSVFQVPENICDRRLINSTEILNLFNAGDKFIVRSIFLQGLLLMPLKNIKTNSTFQEVSKLTNFAREMNTTKLHICLAYAQSIPWASGIVVGVASPRQLREILNSKFKLPNNWETQVGTLPVEILDPRLW